MLYRSRLGTVWRSEIHMNLKMDADADFVSAEHYVTAIKDPEGSILVTAQASTIYAV